MTGLLWFHDWFRWLHMFPFFWLGWIQNFHRLSSWNRHDAYLGLEMTTLPPESVSLKALPSGYD